jgi:hypothetical protein
MSTVSGLATSSGVSSLLNMKLTDQSTSRAMFGERSALSLNPPNETDEKREVRVVSGVTSGNPSLDTDVNVARQDQVSTSRAARFLLAVQALNFDENTEVLSSSKKAEIMQAAREIFMIDDGVPKPVRPAVALDSVQALANLRGSLEVVKTDHSPERSATLMSTERLFENA